MKNNKENKIINQPYKKKYLKNVISLAILIATTLNSCKIGSNHMDRYSDVLENFKNDPLKYQAAKFITSNLSQHYSIQVRYLTVDGKDYTNFLSTYPGELKNTELQDSLKVMPDTKKIYDSIQVSPNYLIKNINESFKIYNKNIKYQKYPFHIFLEYVLPYRVGYEELNEWRPYMNWIYTNYLASFNTTKISMKKLGIIIVAKQTGNSNFSLNRSGNITQPSFHQTIKEIKNVRMPFSCEDYAQTSLYIFRSLGIPAAYEIVPLFGKFNSGHAQTAILYENGKFYPNGSDSAKFKYQIAKMYRRTFSAQPNPYLLIKSLGERIENIPPYFNQSNYIDITKERTEVSEIKLFNDQLANKKVAYLCVYNGGEWRPIDWSSVNKSDNSVCFPSVGRKILYHLAVYERGDLKLTNSPFILDSIGNTLSIGLKDKQPKENIEIFRYDLHADINANNDYSLYYWNNNTRGWQFRQIAKSSGRRVMFTDAPAGSLYKVEPTNSEARVNVRPFTYSKETQVWW